MEKDSSSPMMQDEELYLANSKFESCDELLKSVREFYYAKGYGVSIRDSRKDKYVTLHCDRGGSYRDRLCIGDKRKKNTEIDWALSAFKKTLENREPSVIMSDRELALMNAIKIVFPNTTNLLCIWHIQKNVLANCKRHFSHEEEFDIFLSTWNNVAYSTTRTIFEHNWGEFELLYETKKVAIEYIKNTWLPWKEKFVSAWTESYLHFGNRSSSRAEDAHAKLKLYLQVSTGGFQEVKEKISLAIKHEFNEIKVKLASERIQVLHQCNMPIFRELLYHVSHYALNEIHMQYEKAKNGTLTPCTGHFMATMGLPCAHKIKHLQGIVFSLDLIHPHWRIDTLRLNSEDDSHNDGDKKFDEMLGELSSRYQAWPLSKKDFATSMITKLLTESDTFFEPMIRRPKGRPPKSKKKKGITSTARDPSRFELVESSQTTITSSSSRGFQMNNEDNENNLPDLNAYLTFFSEDII